MCNILAAGSASQLGGESLGPAICADEPAETASDGEIAVGLMFIHESVVLLFGYHSPRIGAETIRPQR